MAAYQVGFYRCEVMSNITLCACGDVLYAYLYGTPFCYDCYWFEAELDLCEDEITEMER